jgi:methoxymalonate biosynthesis acyl carrier protein
MEFESVLQRLDGFIRDRFNVPADDPDFNTDVHLFDYGYIDSFGAVELMAFVQTEYAVEITGADLVAFPLNTIRQIAGLVVGRLKGDSHLCRE